MKAKKIISFCSLFSLVLILSVYYVLSPSVNKGDELVNSEVETDGGIVEIVDGETAYFENLEILKQAAFDEEIRELEDIVASPTSSSEEKITALELKNSKTKLNAKEKELVNLLKSKGYSNVYVEYEGDRVNILVSKKDATKADALDVIRNVYPHLQGKYTPSVSFKA